ncbi:hypothetical protein GCM10023310_68870 [Paenibacillus vulneris]
MKLLLYMIRWQLSSPILYLCINFLPLDNLTKTIVANAIGAILFYPIDKLIFNKKNMKYE